MKKLLFVLVALFSAQLSFAAGDIKEVDRIKDSATVLKEILNIPDDIPKDLLDRAEGYDIPGEIVDGMNFREVRDKIGEVVASIRKESHPAFLEVRTYRYRGHSMSDPASYRTKDELEKYRLDDPIIRLRAQLTREGKLTNEKFDEMDKRAKQMANDSVKFAEESSEPPLEKLYDYTYVP